MKKAMISQPMANVEYTTADLYGLKLIYEE